MIYNIKNHKFYKMQAPIPSINTSPLSSAPMSPLANIRFDKKRINRKMLNPIDPKSLKVSIN
jgi:hypothetical protein